MLRSLVDGRSNQDLAEDVDCCTSTFLLIETSALRALIKLEKKLSMFQFCAPTTQLYCGRHPTAPRDVPIPKLGHN
jgi:hypothetical protein